jgi:hypothetical protein
MWTSTLRRVGLSPGEMRVNKKIRLILIRLLGPFFWLKYIIDEVVYSSRSVCAIAGCEFLVDRGYAIFPNKFDEDDVLKLRQDFKNIEESRHVELTGQLSGRVCEQGPISDLAKTYIELFRPTAEAYFGSADIDCELSMYQRSWPKGDINDIPGGEFHEDNNKRNFKFFVYLTDVDWSNGPFSYVPGTHGLRRPEKYLRWLGWQIFKDRKYLYSYGLNTEECEMNQIKITGPAGTYFCADTTGYHRAVAPISGVREVFVVSFTRK